MPLAKTPLPSKSKVESKSVNITERKTPTHGFVMQEAPAKRETFKREKKKGDGSIRKKEPKKTARRKSSISSSSDINEVATPSFEVRKVSTTSTSDSGLTDRKTDETGSKNETKRGQSIQNSKKFNMELAQNFFKKMAENLKVRSAMKEIEENSHVETMPDGFSARSRKKNHKKDKKKIKIPLDDKIFKPNGEPVWMVPERKPGELAMNKHGELVKNPELDDEIDDEHAEVEEGRGWLNKVNDYLAGKYSKGITDEETALKNIDPFASMEKLKKRSELYFKKETVIYNTVEAIILFSNNSMEKLSQQEERYTRRPYGRKIINEEEQKTCIVTTVRFNVYDTYGISYDRRHPIASIQKFKKKFRKLSIEQANKEKEQTKKYRSAVKKTKKVR